MDDAAKKMISIAETRLQEARDCLDKAEDSESSGWATANALTGLLTLFIGVAEVAVTDMKEQMGG